MGQVPPQDRELAPRRDFHGGVAQPPQGLLQVFFWQRHNLFVSAHRLGVRVEAQVGAQLLDRCSLPVVCLVFVDVLPDSPDRMPQLLSHQCLLNGQLPHLAPPALLLSLLPVVVFHARIVRVRQGLAG